MSLRPPSHPSTLQSGLGRSLEKNDRNKVIGYFQVRFSILGQESVDNILNFGRHIRFVTAW